MQELCLEAELSCLEPVSAYVRVVTISDFFLMQFNSENNKIVGQVIFAIYLFQSAQAPSPGPSWSC